MSTIQWIPFQIHIHVHSSFVFEVQLELVVTMCNVLHYSFEVEILRDAGGLVREQMS